MPSRNLRDLVGAFAIAALLGCADSGVSSPHTPPKASRPLGIIYGTVSGDSLRAQFVPIGAQGAVHSGVSPSIYGGSGTVAVTGTFVSDVQNPPFNRTWTFSVQMENLLSFAIGSNYSDGTTNPPDTSGVFMFFVTPPTVTKPSPCVGCVVTDTNYAGVGNFTAAGQKYYWYKDRPTAVQGTPSTDTTSAQNWVFVAQPFDPGSGLGVNAFTFSLLVSAAWPADQDSASNYVYNALTDSEPDLHGKPQWSAPFAQDVGLTTLGSESWTVASGLTLNAAANGSVFLSRRDSLDPAWNFSIQAKLNVLNTGNDSVQAILGFVGPTASDKQIFVGIWPDSVAFMHLDNVTGGWTVLSGSTKKHISNGSHLVSVSSLGGALAFFCVDHSLQTFLSSYSLLDAPSATFLTSHPSAVVFGTVGNTAAAGQVLWSNVMYQINTSSLVC